MKGLTLDSKKRETGIEVLGKIPWGTHFCLFYEDKDDLLDILIPYFREGLENNEYCIWVTSEPLTKKEAEGAAEKEIPNFEKYLKKKHIEIIPYDEWYLKDIGLQRVLNDWVEKLNHARSQGYDGLRLTENTAWLEKTDWKSFTDYEEDVNNVISNYEMIVICTYSLENYGPYEILDVIHNHQFALIRKEGAWEIFKNMGQIRAETVLKKSEEKYRLLIENALEGVLTIDKDGIISYVNSRMADILGYSVDEILGKDLTNFMDDYSIKVIERNIGRGKQGVREQHDFKFLRNNGTKAYIILETTPINDEKGNYIGTFVFMADITKRKLADQKIKASEEKFRTIFKSIPDLFFLLSEDTTILEYSGKKEELYFPPEKFLGQKAKDILPPNIGKLCLESVKNTIKTKQPQSIEYALPMNDEIRFFEGRFLYFSEKNVALFTRDITDRKMVEKKLRESEHNLKERVKDLNCLYEISKLIENPKISVGEIIQGTLELIPHAWQFPDIICARIKYGNSEYKTEHFKLTEWKFSNYFRINGNILELEVLYLEDKPFLAEEVSLLKDIGHRLKILIEQKEAEQKIIDSEEKFRTAVENSPDFMIFIKTDGTIFDVNRLERGFTREMVIGQSVFNRSFYETEDQLESSRKAICDSLENGEITHFEYSQIAPDGSRSFYETRVCPFGYDNKDKIISLQLATRDITERKKAEQKIIESEDRYRDLYENAPNAFFSISFDKSIIRCNKSAEKLLGYTKDELLGMKVLDLYANTENGIEKAKKNFQRFLKGDEIKYEELKMKRKDGKNIWISLSVKPVLDQKGDVVESRSMVIDISDRKKAEQKLKESEEKFRELFNNMSSGVAVYEAINDGEDFTFKEFNLSGEKIENIKKEDLIGNSVLKMFPGVKEFGLFDVFQRVWKTGFPEHHPITLYKDNRITGWRENYVYKLPSGEIVAVYDDITPRKIAEQNLKASEERFRTLYENIAGGTLIVDDNFIIKDVNERTCEITGYKRDELIGQLCNKLCARKSDYQKCPIWEEGQEGFRGMDTTIKCKDGRKHPILKNVKKIDLEGDVHILENFQDIKEKKEAEEELLKLNELKTELLTRSSHELKTPLMFIKGFTELLTLKFQDTLNDEELSLVSEIKKGCSRLETLINDILKTAELESGTIHLEKTEEDLSMLIKKSVRELQSFANSRNQNINLMLHDKLIISLEKKQIHQAINNLLTNAIKYTPPNGKIEIKSDIKEDRFIISIKDSGIGFSEEEKSRVFKQFGKIERYGQGFDVVTEGSGLGLYISKKIVELHGGDIWVESDGRNKGSTFYFSVPIIRS